MDLNEAKEQITYVLRLADVLNAHMPQLKEALEIAVKCLNAQLYLKDLQGDVEMSQGVYSAGLVKDILSACSYDWSDEDG